MEKSIVVKYEHRDGRTYLNLYSGSGKQINYDEWLNIMVGALSMTIRMAGEQRGPDGEGEVYRMVKEHLEREFINADSFKDLEIRR